MLVRQYGILSPGVRGDMDARCIRPSFSKKHIPAVGCTVMSNFRRSISSSNASLYGHGDMYIVAVSWGPMRYCDTSSDASSFPVSFVGGVGFFNAVDTVAAWAVMLYRSNSCSGSGCIVAWEGGDHLSLLTQAGVRGGQETAWCGMVVGGASTVGWSSKLSWAVIPKSYSSCAAGGRLC